MKSFIFTFVIVSCFLLSQALSSLESSTMPPLTTLTTRTTSENSSAAPAPASVPAVEVVHPFAKAVTAATKTEAPGQQCKKIGEPCRVSDECCSRRCVSYRSRCAY